MLRLGEPLLSAEHVSYRYGSRWALDDVSVELATGVTALVGENGAGKTTLLQLLATSLRCTSGSLTFRGEAVVGGADTRRLRASIGYVPQHVPAARWLTAQDYVEYAAYLRGVPISRIGSAAAGALDAVGLTERRRSRTSELSGGMMRRLAIAAAVVHEPAVILLDEPTVGLDPVQRHSLRDLVRAIGASAAVLLSTHLVEDAASVADRVVVLSHGRVLKAGSPEDVLGGPSGHGSAAEAAIVRLLSARNPDAPGD